MAVILTLRSFTHSCYLLPVFLEAARHKHLAIYAFHKAPSITGSSRPSYSPVHPAICLYVRVGLVSTDVPTLAFYLPSSKPCKASLCSTAQKHTHPLHDDMADDIGLCLIRLVVPSPETCCRPLPHPTNTTHLATRSLYIHQTLAEYPRQTVSRTSSTTRLSHHAVAPSGYFTFDCRPQYSKSRRDIQDNEPLGSQHTVSHFSFCCARERSWPFLITTPGTTIWVY